MFASGRRQSVSSLFVTWLGLVCVTSVVSACSGIPSLLPSSGPNSIAVEGGIGAQVPYAIVRLKAEVLDVLARYEPAGLAGAFSSRKPPPRIKFGIGDVVSVTIFEASAGGLFIPIEAGVRPGNFVTLPNQTIDNGGNLNVPFAGAVPAAGRTNIEIQDAIIARIRNRAIEPQVIVALATQNTSLITVLGDVNNQFRYPASSVGARDRVTDAITRAGGIKGEGFRTWVMLERDGKRATVPFANLLYETSNNIFVQPGDRIYVYQEDQKFIAFGASGQQGEFPFGAWRINLASAVAKAGGLNDGQADPASVYLYRSEPRHVAELLGVDVTRFEGDIIPVVFSVNFRDPSGYFLATKLQMRNSDILFVSNAEGVEITKLTSFLNAIMQTVSNEYGLHAIIKGTIQPVAPTVPSSTSVSVSR